MSTLTCLHCTAPTNGVVLCPKCQRTAGTALTNIASYHANLFSLPGRVFGLRHTRGVSDPTGSAVALRDARDPIADEAAETKTALVGWVRALVDDRPQAFYPTEDTVSALVRVLSQQLRSIATLEWAGEFIADLLRIEKRLRRTLEANKGLWYAGVCGKVRDEATGAFCNRVLYADPDKSHVFCPACRTIWPVTERRRILLNLARDEVTNVATIARACAVLLGEEEASQAKLERRIQNWIDRGKLERRGSVDVDGHVRKVYRLGDVLDMLIDTRSRATSGQSA